MSKHLIQIPKSDHCFMIRLLPDGRRMDVYPLFGGRARIGIARRSDDLGYDGDMF